METYDLAGARRAAVEGRLLGWFVEMLRREPGANRSLAAILRGHEALLEGPVVVALDDLIQSAGPGAGFKWPKEPERWEREVAAIMALAPESLPPLLIRETGGVRHLPDGSHRLDAWRRMGLTHGWTALWRDRDPRFAGWWGPFLPDETATVEVVEPERVRGFLPPVEAEGTILAATLGERVVGAMRLVPEFDGLTLRTMRVDEAFRGRRLGARLLHHAGPLMDGHVVHCLAYPWLARFYGEAGFVPVDPAELPEGLRTRYESFLDERGCAALRREP